MFISELSKKAGEEIGRFQLQKNINLQESLANYVMLQLKLSKMVCKYISWRRCTVRSI